MTIKFKDKKRGKAMVMTTITIMIAIIKNIFGILASYEVLF
jgi:hypothetical protein